VEETLEVHESRILVPAAHGGDDGRRWTAEPWKGSAPPATGFGEQSSPAPTRPGPLAVSVGPSLPVLKYISTFRSGDARGAAAGRGGGVVRR